MAAFLQTLMIKTFREAGKKMAEGEARAVNSIRQLQKQKPPP
ncbi:hypothetical protein P262_01608 [Cronobacter malonaticus]|uniref:Uncharacterized protein n=1 Tax=Cronobacter malonaticus TaxID=413503 RepID=V5TXS3_9ENTR|nr:hypothetical protein P262_01608 [Cronobacter malonaticus]CCJ93559.1 hypothetical protein BN131_1232 [Cronobacter malonaticus 681]